MIIVAAKAQCTIPVYLNVMLTTRFFSFRNSFREFKAGAHMGIVEDELSMFVFLNWL
jgi:hypothetical protein